MILLAHSMVRLTAPGQEKQAGHDHGARVFDDCGVALVRDAAALAAAIEAAASYLPGDVSRPPLRVSVSGWHTTDIDRASRPCAPPATECR
jgi:hypothetical protein